MSGSRLSLNKVLVKASVLSRTQLKVINLNIFIDYLSNKVRKPISTNGTYLNLLKVCITYQQQQNNYS